MGQGQYQDDERSKGQNCEQGGVYARCKYMRKRSRERRRRGNNEVEKERRGER